MRSGSGATLLGRLALLFPPARAEVPFQPRADGAGLAAEFAGEFRNPRAFAPAPKEVGVVFSRPCRVGVGVGALEAFDAFGAGLDAWAAFECGERFGRGGLHVVGSKFDDDLLKWMSGGEEREDGAGCAVCHRGNERAVEDSVSPDIKRGVGAECNR